MVRYSGLLILALSAAGPAAAHHGFGSFDVTRDLEIRGAITRLDFVNPHSWLYLEVTADNGAEDPEHWVGQFRHADVVYPSETPYVADPCEEAPFEE